MECSHHGDYQNDSKCDESKACTGGAIRMATLKYSEAGQSCHDVHECSVCNEREGRGRRGRGEEGGGAEKKEGEGRRRGRGDML